MAVTKRSSKKVSKLKILGRLFNPRSLKAGMMLFALVFAVSGAGYFAYQSFAATYEKVFLANKIIPYDFNNSYSPQKVTEPAGEKKNITVWNVPKGDEVGSGPFSVSGGNYNFCVTARYLISSGTADIRIAGSAGGVNNVLGGGSRSFSTSYSKKCITQSMGNAWLLNVTIHNPRDYNLRVSSISIEKL